MSTTTIPAEAPVRFMQLHSADLRAEAAIEPEAVA
jgi:hypothetical protein